MEMEDRAVLESLEAVLKALRKAKKEIKEELEYIEHKDACSHINIIIENISDNHLTLNRYRKKYRIAKSKVRVEPYRKYQKRKRKIET
ncbi:hypothetical protein [Mycoplasma sp. P36-A1]|uniref:hypothetical protein n=1 Tax=Mycoplasma sp. P36-A1 TaxID=3252900 RepID=UPI003C2C2354